MLTQITTILLMMLEVMLAVAVMATIAMGLIWLANRLMPNPPPITPPQSSPKNPLSD